MILEEEDRRRLQKPQFKGPFLWWGGRDLNHDRGIMS